MMDTVNESIKLLSVSIEYEYLSISNAFKEEWHINLRKKIDW